MTNKGYLLKLSKLKGDFDSLTNELWKDKNIRQDYYSKEQLQNHIVEDMYTFQKGILNIQLEK